MAAADYRLMTEATGQRIAVALENLAGFGNYLTSGDVVNSLISTATDKPLSAAQGKTLNDKIVVQIGSYTLPENVTIQPNSNLAIVEIAYGIFGGWLENTNVVLPPIFVYGSKWYSHRYVSLFNTSSSEVTIPAGMTIYYLYSIALVE